MAIVKLDPPPIQHPIADPSAQFLTPQPWALWFQKLRGDGGTGGLPAFGVIAVANWDNIAATQQYDTLTIQAGANISLETNPLGKILTINAVGGAPAPPDTSVQFNDAGAFGGNAAFEFKKLVTTVLIGTNHTEGTTGAANLLVGEGHTVLSWRRTRHPRRSSRCQRPPLGCR